jgi:hypothetical protein
MQPGGNKRVNAPVTAMTRRDSDHPGSNSVRSLFIECTLITYHLPTSLHPVYKRMISCFTPDIQSVISSPLDRVSMSTWMASASSRSWVAIAVLHFSTRLTTRRWTSNVPLVSSPSCATTGVDNVSQFNASNKGFIRRSRSSTRRR